MTRESKADFDKLLSGYSPQVRALARKVRRRVLEVLPGAHEKTYFGWSNTWYGTGERNADAIFTISPQKRYVSLFFLKGTELSDPDALLEETGKKLRHVNLREVADLDRLALRRLMKRAVAHGTSRRRKAERKA